MFILPIWSFYQGTASAPSTTGATSAETGGIGENLFSSSPAVSFHLLRFSSSLLYLKSIAQEHIV